MIGGVELIAACNGHRDRTSVAPDEDGASAIERVFMAEQIDPTEAREAIKVVADGREEHEGVAEDGHSGYLAGLIEGFLLGVRAGRAEVEPGLEAFASLSYRERDVVLRRAQGETVEQIAARFAVTPSRIGHIYDQAIKVLRARRVGTA